MRIKFQGSFIIGICFRAKVSNVTARVNSHLDSPKSTNALVRGSIILRFLPCILVGQSGVVAIPTPPTIFSIGFRGFVSSTLYGHSHKFRDCYNSGGHGCLELRHGDSRCRCTGAALGALCGSTPRGCTRIKHLPMLGLLGRGKSIVDLDGVMLVLDVGHLVNFYLRDKPVSMRVATTATTRATARPDPPRPRPPPPRP